MGDSTLSPTSSCFQLMPQQGSSGSSGDVVLEMSKLSARFVGEDDAEQQRTGATRLNARGEAAAVADPSSAATATAAAAMTGEGQEPHPASAVAAAEAEAAEAYGGQYGAHPHAQQPSSSSSSRVAKKKQPPPPPPPRPVFHVPTSYVCARVVG